MDDFDNAVSRSLARTGIWKLTIESITGKCNENKAKNKMRMFSKRGMVSPELVKHF